MGKTAEAVDYSLTERDMRELTYYAELAAKKVEDVYLTDVLAALASNEKPYAEELIKDEWQGEVAIFARALLLDGDGEITFEVDGQPARLSKPKFKKEHRLLGLKLLSKTVFPKEKWAEATRKLIDSTFEARLGDCHQQRWSRQSGTQRQNENFRRRYDCTLGKKFLGKNSS